MRGYARPWDKTNILLDEAFDKAGKVVEIGPIQFLIVHIWVGVQLSASTLLEYLHSALSLVECAPILQPCKAIEFSIYTLVDLIPID